MKKDRNAAEILKKNLIQLGINKNANVVVDEIKNFLKEKISEKFEIIFLDPPFAENNYVKELELIKKALERNNGKRKAAAIELGISERTLYRKIKQHDIEL